MTEIVIATPAKIAAQVISYGNTVGTAGVNCTAAFTIAYLSGMSHKKVNDLINKLADSQSKSAKTYKGYASKASDRIGTAIDLNRSYDVIFAQVKDKLTQFGRDRCIEEGRPNDKPTFSDCVNNLMKVETTAAKKARLESEKALKDAKAANVEGDTPPEVVEVELELNLDDVLAFIATSDSEELNVMIEAITARMEALAKVAVAA